jgi:hypothetical protein
VLEVLERSGIGKYQENLGEVPRRHISQRQSGADGIDRFVHASLVRRK